MGERVTTRCLLKKKQKNERIVELTAYDYSSAVFADESGVDIILVGDSLGMVVLGYENTLKVTLDDMIYHTKAVSRGAKRALIVADMPFMTFQVSKEQALENAGKLIQKGDAHAVKLEGGGRIVETVEYITSAGIPVQGHLGLTPQSIHQTGGYKVQGKTDKAARQMVEDARALQDAGAFSIVLECVPGELASWITSELKIPTIGIGAGKDTSGQVLVYHDLLGFSQGYMPKFVRKYQNLGDLIKEAISAYVDDVRECRFPSDVESYHLKQKFDIAELIKEMELKGEI